jgi:hypothetical protein
MSAVTSTQSKSPPLSTVMASAALSTFTSAKVRGAWHQFRSPGAELAHDNHNSFCKGMHSI